ncbi:UNVERIFIED_ORG: putative MFS family arabinose efflux permease [Zoogloea ramigera]|uniref:MFS transporter n=1 Tax=Duganella zoogloeoides TaxID=75659 RepID=A0ABZ0Y5K6_9BURK|nr:MFS transporter [Duganella zoogloeoides]WQH06686.1 MFS transporter [Duganella zoogloeoides]
MYSPSLPRPLVVLFACASGFCVANVYYAQPLLGALADDFGIARAAIGVVVTATQAGSVLALLLLVPLGDLLPRRRLMLWQMLALVVALLAAASASSAGWLMAVMLMVGLLGTAMTQGLISYAAAAADASERGAVVGAAQGGVVSGLLLARVVAGAVADLAGWRAVYGGSAMAMLVMAVLLWRLLPVLPVQQAALSYPRLLASMFTLLRDDRVLRVHGVIALLMFAAFNILWSALVLPLSAAPYHYSHTAIGAFGLVGLGGTLAAARAGQWADHGHSRRTSAVALVLLLLSWLPLSAAFAPGAGAAPTAFMLVLGILMLDLGVQALHVTNQSLIFRGGNEAHSRLVGCYMLFYAVGSGTGAWAATAVFDIAGWHGVCTLGAGVSLAALVFWAVAGTNNSQAAPGK